MKLYFILLTALFCLAAASMGNELEDDYTDVTAENQVENDYADVIADVVGNSLEGRKKCAGLGRMCKDGYTHRSRKCCSGLKCKQTDDYSIFQMKVSVCRKM